MPVRGPFPVAASAARPLRQWLPPLLVLGWVPLGAVGEAAASAAAVLTLPSDNDLARYRADPEMWSQSWAPQPVDGKAWHLSLRADRSSDWDFLYPFESELAFEGSWLTVICRRFWWLSYFFALLYIVGLRWGQAFMKERQAFEFKWVLAAWNLCLAVYSFFGAIRTVPTLLTVLLEHGFDYSVCRAALPMYGSGPCSAWVALFIFSKYFELIDTAFLVLRKRSVSFLHWYHHFSVLLYTWHAYIWETPTGIYFVSMNYSVHAIMYFYYFLAGVTKPPRWALLVTILQLSQMAIGIFATVSHLHRLLSGSIPRCDGHVPNLVLALAMYSTYFYLFGEFLVNRYFRRRKPASGAAKGASGKLNSASDANGVDKATNGKKAEKHE